MKYSTTFGGGIYQWEWREDKIEIAQWSEPPTSSSQWLKVDGGRSYHLEGTSNDDLRVVVAPRLRIPDPPDAKPR